MEKLKGIYEETKVRIRTEEGLTTDFWIGKGLRQGCVLRPILFSNIYKRIRREI